MRNREPKDKYLKHKGYLLLCIRRNPEKGGPQLNAVKAIEGFPTTFLTLSTWSEDGCSPSKHQALPISEKVGKKGRVFFSNIPSSYEKKTLPTNPPVNYHLCSIAQNCSCAVLFSVAT